MGGGREKIPYPFVPLPTNLCKREFFHSPSLFVFICWVYSRISFYKKSTSINGQLLELEAGEFIFGRRACSEEIGVSEQTLRTLIKNLTSQGKLEKITSKSTNKFSVFRLVWVRFSDITNPIINQQPTSNQPAGNHKQEQEEEKESKRATFLLTAIEDGTLLQRVTSHLKGKAFDLFSVLPSNEQQAICELLDKRRKNKPITNLDGWIVNCIHEGWHCEKSATLPSQQDACNANREINYALAQRVAQALQDCGNIYVHCRKDFLELGSMGSAPWQLFFSESALAFKGQIEHALKFLNLNLQHVIQG